MAESSLSYDLAWSEGAVVTAETSRGGPIKLAIVDCELVVAGVTTMLADRRHRVRVVEPGPAPGSPFLADVVLYDPDGPEGYHRLHRLVDDACARVVVFSWSTDAGAIDRAMLVGAAGYLFKGVPAQLASGDPR